MDEQIIQPSWSNHGQGGAIAQLQAVLDCIHTQCAKKASNDILQDVAINKMAPPEKGCWTAKAAVHPHPAKADPLLKSKVPKPAFINAEQNSAFGFNSMAPSSDVEMEAGDVEAAEECPAEEAFNHSELHNNNSESQSFYCIL